MLHFVIPLPGQREIRDFFFICFLLLHFVCSFVRYFNKFVFGRRTMYSKRHISPPFLTIYFCCTLSLVVVFLLIRTYFRADESKIEHFSVTFSNFIFFSIKFIRSGGRRRLQKCKDEPKTDIYENAKKKNRSMRLSDVF